MKQEDLDRKQALLAEATGVHRHYEDLLNRYSRGEDVRRQVADNIVAEFRKVLRANGPNYDGTLYARLIEAFIAAEANGAASVRPRPKAPFSPGEVQRCLLCSVEYQPALEVHQCEQR